MTAPLDHASFASRYHTQMTNNRIVALNRLQSNLSDATREFMDLFTKYRLSTNNAACGILRGIEDTNANIKNEITTLKREFGIVKHCNHQYLMINTLQTDDDLRRYIDFMFITYHKYVREISNICQVMETHREYIHRQTFLIEMSTHDTDIS